MKSNWGCILGILAFAVVFTLIATGLSKIGILPPDLESRSFSEDVGSSIIIVLIVVGLFYLLYSIGIIRKKDDGGIKHYQQPYTDSTNDTYAKDVEYCALSDPHFDDVPDEFDPYDEDEDDFSDLDEDAEPPSVWYVKPGEGIGNICIYISTLNDVVASFGEYYKIEKREPEINAAVYIGGLEFFFNTDDPQQTIRKIKVSTSYSAVLNVDGTLFPFMELLFDGKLNDELATGREKGWRFSKSENAWYLKANGAIYYATKLNSNGISEIVVVMNHLHVASMP